MDSAVVDNVVCCYDDIMNEVVRVAEPVSATYERVQEEYAWLLDVLEKKRRNRDVVLMGE